MKTWIGLFIILCISSFGADAQYTRYIIQFKNKGGTPYSLNNPQQFLSPRAIARRTRYNIPYDSTDLPVTPRYVDSLRLAGAVTILNISKWMNSVTIQTNDAAALNKINSFPFVQSARAIAEKIGNISNTRPKKITTENGTAGAMDFQSTLADSLNYGLSGKQVRIHNGEFLHNIGLRGQNMIIGMLDAGYFNYTSLRAFDSARLNGQILGTWDFVANENSVVEDHPHGMQCFSIIVANIPGQFIGTAPKANFYLYRTEDAATEFPIEEHNWVVGAERVDSVGGDLISASLGYTTFDSSVFNHTYAELNGNTAIASIGADMAAKKGILVVTAAGNDGSSSWKFISVPADADSALTVGAVDTLQNVASFSSYGPTSDGQIKPDVASVGVKTIIQGTNNTVTSGNGTSFATPNMAGIVTCLWQGFQEFNNMKIIDALRRSGSQAHAPNDRVGYGLPDAKKAMLILLKDVSTASATITACKSTIIWSSKDVRQMSYHIERKLPGENSFSKIGERSGTGTTFSTQNHQFIDSIINAPAGAISYRIRQIIDTSVTGFSGDYIDTVTVNSIAACVTTPINNVPNEEANIFLSPNPARESFNLKMTTAAAISQLTIRIVDGAGKTVQILKKSKPSGIAIINISAAHFAPGKYYVSIFDREKLLATKEFLKL